MHYLPGLRFDEEHPRICASVRGETMEELRQAIRSLYRHPFDVLEVSSAAFNGISNFSQIGSALLLITSHLKDQPVIFSCSMSELPDYCRSEEDYKNILLFAVRTGLVDAVEIDAFVSADTINDIADQAFEEGIIPILTIRCAVPFSEVIFAEQLFSIVSEDISVYHIICHLETQEEAAEYLEVIRTCTAAHEDAHFIIELTGKGSKDLLRSRQSFSSPLLYAAETETDDRLSIAELRQILSKK